ncbi:MAG: restriction endonuclease [Victivallales bacterium]|nr:restriction endonuclease [Victivallales bacterium]
MNWQEKINEIRILKLNIYDKLPKNELFFTTEELSDALKNGLIGFSLAGMPLRTRSKIFKTKVCEVLGYIVPKSFIKCQPRFVNQNFDTYVQKNYNLQIWNEEIDPKRRYVIVKLNEDDIINAVKVITGEELVKLDKTGTLTHKYQARIERKIDGIEIFSEKDSINILPHKHCLAYISPLAMPNKYSVLSLTEIAGKLPELLQHRFSFLGATQERKRGGHIHVMLCKVLGYTSSEDDGQFPDIKNQLIEVKLQTSPTIDLGQYSPSDESPTEIVYEGKRVRHCDVRYVVFSAKIENDVATITGIALGNGFDFYTRFPQFGGKVVNKKIQIPLPFDFFD